MTKPEKTLMTRVIRDPRDANQDYYIPETRARELLEAGLLYWDRTNKTYCLPTIHSPKVT